jgi:hypothetical protein
MTQWLSAGRDMAHFWIRMTTAASERCRLLHLLQVHPLGGEGSDAWRGTRPADAGMGSLAEKYADEVSILPVQHRTLTRAQLVADRGISGEPACRFLRKTGANGRVAVGWAESHTRLWLALCFMSHVRGPDFVETI